MAADCYFSFYKKYDTENCINRQLGIEALATKRNIRRTKILCPFKIAFINIIKVYSNLIPNILQNYQRIRK